MGNHLNSCFEQTCREWAERFLLWNGGGMGGMPAEEDARAFLGDLAVRGGVAKSTQKQAVNAMGYLFRQVLGVYLNNNKLSK